MKATSFAGVYVDGDRERIPYEADAYINQLGHYCCDREFTLARYSLDYLMTHPCWPTEWHLYMVLMAWADYLQTGDAAPLLQHYADLKAKTLTALAREDGLISVETGLVTDDVLRSIHFTGTLRDVIDWPQCERDNYALGAINTVTNALHCEALRLMAQIAQAVGQQDDAAWYAERAQLVRASLQEKLIDPDTGLFIDSEGSRHSSLHANLFPLAFGLAPAASEPRMVALLKDKGMACSVYAAQFLLEALYRADEDDYAYSLLTSRTERSWAHMLEVGSTIALEAWDNRFKPNQDWNHAWGAAPANLIPRWLMGIRPLEPGFQRILIHPQPGPLRFAEITLPTIRGPITVRLQHDPQRSLHLDLTIPGNTSARVVVPWFGSTDRQVYVDGRPVTGTELHGQLIVDALPAGRHTVLRKPG